MDRSAPLTDDFAAEYVRSARNTHHGYISDGDRRRRFACYGSISTAFLPRHMVVVRAVGGIGVGLGRAGDGPDKGPVSAARAAVALLALEECMTER